jgi:DNA topoisomerase IB-like protein
MQKPSGGLRYVSDGRPGIGRKRAGTGFTYISHDGGRVAEANALKRIKSLAIPPGPTSGYAPPLTATFRRLDGMQRDASSTVTILAFERCGKAPNMGMWWLSPTRCPASGRQ